LLFSPAIAKGGAAQNLRHLRAALLRQKLRRLVAVVALEDADLDQLVRLELLSGGPHQRVADAFVTDLQHGLQVMSERAQVTALLAGHRALASRGPAERRATKSSCCSGMSPSALATGVKLRRWSGQAPRALSASRCSGVG